MTYFCDIKQLHCTIHDSICKKETKPLCDNANIISSYNSRAEEILNWSGTRFDKNTRNQYLFGIELEVESFPPSYTYTSRNTISEMPLASISPHAMYAAKVYRWSKLLHKKAIIKSDGSLLFGLEIVTPPQTYNKLKETIINICDLFEEEKEKCALYTSPRCGTHIHISRPPPTITKKLLVLYSSLTTDQLYLIGERKPNDFCRPLSIRKDQLMAKVPPATDKYRTINTNKSTTIEFRLFAAKQQHNILLSYLEFVQASLSFCEETAWPSITTKNFFTYILDNKNIFPNAYLKINHYINKNKENDKIFKDQVIKQNTSKIDIKLYLMSKNINITDTHIETEYPSLGEQ